MIRSSPTNSSRLLRLALTTAIVAILGVSLARAQETWAPVIMFDGTTITTTSGTVAIQNGPVPVAPHYVFGPPAPGEPDPLISYPNVVAENRLTNEWIVADSYHSRLLRFATDHNSANQAGAYLGSIAVGGGNSTPYSPVIDDDGVMLVPDFLNNTLFAFTPSGSSYVASQITAFQNGSTPDHFNQPRRVALIADPVNGMHLALGIGTVVVLDSAQNRVLKLTPTGGVAAPAWTLQLAFGQAASASNLGPGKFVYPTGLAVDAAGNIYVTDPNNPNLISIQVFDPSGVPLQTISQ